MNENKLQIYKNKIQYYKTLINQVGGTIEIFFKTKEGEYSKTSDDLYTGYGYIFNTNVPEEINKDFQGEFKNGLKNGHGISYYHNKVKYYEGEYKDNIKNGYGIQYYPRYSTTKQFEGFIGEIELNNFPNINIGKDKWLCTEFDENGKIKYYGYIENKQYNGNGVLFTDEFEPKLGFFQNGVRISDQVTDRGYKTFSINNDDEQGLLFIDIYLKDGQQDGFGVEFNSYNQTKIYEGEFKDNSYNGKGILYGFKDKNRIYKGELKKWSCKWGRNRIL